MGSSNSKTSKRNSFLITVRSLSGGGYFDLSSIKFHLIVQDDVGTEYGPFIWSPNPMRKGLGDKSSKAASHNTVSTSSSSDAGIEKEDSIRMDKFRIPKFLSKGGKRIVHVEFWMNFGQADSDRHSIDSDSNAGPTDWFVESMIVEDRTMRARFPFPLHEWIRPDLHYSVGIFNTCLPQFDPNADMRKHLLEKAREIFLYTQKPSMRPLRSKHDLDLDEAHILKHSRLNSQMTDQKWDNLDEVLELYNEKLKGTPFRVPQSVQFFTDRLYMNDRFFGWQRVAGCNANRIQLCQSLPDGFADCEDTVKQFMEFWSFEDLINAKRLFLVDYSHLLEGMYMADGRPMCAPVALLFKGSDHLLVPLAIRFPQWWQPPEQLHNGHHGTDGTEHSADQNHANGDDLTTPSFILTPADSEPTWMLAKMWFNMADATVHLALGQIEFNRMVLERVCTCTHRRLADTHPIHRLLAPHFLDLFSLNDEVFRKTLQKSGWLDQITSAGADSLLELVERASANWKLDVQGNLPLQLTANGVRSARILPIYPYRDDAMATYAVLERYVGAVVRTYYGTDSPDGSERLDDDFELHQWLLELHDEGLVERRDFSTVDSLINLATNIVFMCSVQNAAVSNPMFDHYGFPFAYPVHLDGEPPRPGQACTWDDVLEALPTRRQTVITSAVAHLLGRHLTKPLGQFDVQYLFDPPSERAAQQLRDELVSVGAEIEQRDGSQRAAVAPYPYLHPKNVANCVCC